MEDALYFILLDVKSKELLCIIFSMYAFFYIHSHNRKIFKDVKSLTEGKKTIYHRNGRREKWKKGEGKGDN